MVQQLKLFFIVVLFITLMNVSFISAIPPHQVSGDLVIEHPQVETLKQNTSYNFRFHLFNSTSLIGSNAGCGFSLYNPEGVMTYQNNSIIFISGSNNEFAINLTASNFTRLGLYSFVTECNTSTQAGFAASAFEITPSGKGFNTGTSVIYMGTIFILLIFSLGGFILASQLPASNTRDEEGKLMSISWLKYFRSTIYFVEYIFLVAILYISSNVAFVFLPENLTANVLFTLYQVAFRLAPVVLIIWISWIFVKIFQDKQFWGMMKRGMFPQGNL